MLATDDFTIEGGHKLSGTITTNPSKNGALGLMCASLLNRGTTILHNIPRIEEIERMIEVFLLLDIHVEWIDLHTIKIVPPQKFALDSILTSPSAKAMRSTIMLIGSLAHHVDEFSIPHAGGCKMGERTIIAHCLGLQSFGIDIETQENVYHITSTKRHAGICTLYEASDTGTENILIAAAGFTESCDIYFPQQNYMVQDVMGFLRALGTTIEQIDTITLRVTGKGLVNTTIEYWNSEDPIESMAFLTAGIITDSEITVTRCPIDFLRLEILKLETMGQKFTFSSEYRANNGCTRLVDITVHPSILTALHDKIMTIPYPGINTDNLPFFVPIALKAHGRTLIHDWMWENRAIYFTELNRMGASITLADQHRVFIDGPSTLKPTQIVCPPALRPSVIILLTMMAAPGTSILRNVYSIRRGYEDIDIRLNALGARIQKINPTS